MNDHVSQEQVRIVIIDDNDSDLLAAKRILQRLGFQRIATLQDPKAAAEQIEDDRFDLIISDWYMPELSGLELLQRVRKNNKKIPFIMITSDASQQNVAEALQCGINGYILKPLDSEQFVDAVMSAITTEGVR